jgi:hypothetical protein
VSTKTQRLIGILLCSTITIFLFWHVDYARSFLSIARTPARLRLRTVVRT